ncbi:hypothetical protein ACFQBQ_07725 [Granulicella cerasi]|uniref:Uncharacterized protein n=1 Tax=Granulicella cerasi TaxID=741063 RepID=A0ABW1Z9T4_9BACT|nr:hypothetical protein [Granulicella cerasi]
MAKLTPLKALEIERSHAFDSASSIIECHCLKVEVDGFEGDYYDLNTCDETLTTTVAECADYLEWLGCIHRIQGAEHIVGIFNESEALREADALPTPESSLDLFHEASEPTVATKRARVLSLALHAAGVVAAASMMVREGTDGDEALRRSSLGLTLRLMDLFGSAANAAEAITEVANELGLNLIPELVPTPQEIADAAD